MTFYRLFENKEEIAKIILKNQLNGRLKDLTELLQSDLSFLEKVEKSIASEQIKLDQLSEAFFKDIYNESRYGYKKMVEHHQKSMKELTFSFFKKAQIDGHIRKDLKIDFILYLMGAVSQKAQDPQLIELFPNSKEAIIHLIRHFFYGIVTTEKN